MNQVWLDFLTQQSATRDDLRTLCFDTAENERQRLTTNVTLADLSHYTIVQVTGADAAKFLQNQLTNDIGKITPSQSRIAGYCTPKGRLLAIFRVLLHHSDYLLVFPKKIATATLQRLKKYVLMSKVQFACLDEQWSLMGIAGDNAVKYLETMGFHMALSIDAVAFHDGLTIVTLESQHPRFLLLGPIAQLIDLWRRAQHLGAVPVGYLAWNWYDVAAGYPELDEATIEAFVPQMMNFEALDGLSFTKGCYPGQEIVARMAYLGTLKRRMYLLHAETTDLPKAGDAIYSIHARADDVVGIVVNAAMAPSGGIDVLAVLQINHAEQNGLCLGSPSGPALSIQALSYNASVGKTAQASPSGHDEMLKR